MEEPADRFEDLAALIEVDGEFCIPSETGERRYILDDRPSKTDGPVRAAIRKVTGLGRPGRAPA